ncbi:hypothetical protein chiPu_0020550 [Chiloscyllium punctatum]|uniref:Uncharacterized protein n=1 Tax=Chiloscyllium punctatum TaxID=137246 RepID=A0A401RGV0_CHIPU|nr:hypothetical protein [Chiloscyllium punctatum]
MYSAFRSLWRCCVTHAGGGHAIFRFAPGRVRGGHVTFRFAPRKRARKSRDAPFRGPTRSRDAPFRGQKKLTWGRTSGNARRR